MTKSALIEALARQMYNDWDDDAEEFDFDDDLGESAQRPYREQAERLLPLIVEAFAEWLERESYSHHYGWTGDSIRAVSQRFRKDMTA